MKPDLQQLTPDQVIDLNDRAREYLGKSAEQLTLEDLATLRTKLSDELTFLYLERDFALSDLESIVEAIRRRGPHL